jgi:hypothetical protein
MPTLLAEEGDLWMVMSGTNDILGGLTIQESKDNWDAIAALIVGEGKKLLIVPVAYRNRVGEDPMVYNGRADELNAHLVTIAASNPDIAIAEENAEWNAGVMTDQVTWGGLTDDGLHPNGYGGVVLGKEPAIALDLYFPSVIEDKSVMLGEFSGTGGTLSIGTGVMPDGWKGYFANNSTEDGFTGPIDRGDGKVWWKCRSNGGAVTNQDNRIIFESHSVDDGSEGWYVGELTVEFEQGVESLISCLVQGESVDSGFFSASHQYLNPIDPNSLKNGVEYSLRTPSIKGVSGGKQFEIQTSQNMGDDVIMYVTDMKLYKVKDKDWI